LGFAKKRMAAVEFQLRKGYIKHMVDQKVFSPTVLKMQPKMYLPITVGGAANLRHHFRVGHYAWTERTHPLPATRIDTSIINNDYELVKLIREQYGYGKFVLCFWTGRTKNKKFDPFHRCSQWECKWFKTAKCHMYKKKLAYPEHYKVCRVNYYWQSNWQKRAIVIVQPKLPLTEQDDDFTYKYLENDMLKYYRWFWKGRVQKREEELYF